MKMKTIAIDWNAAKETAKMMTTGQILGAIRDIIATLPNADAMDRANGTDLGGKYRDQSSVYRAELKARGAMSPQ